MSNAIQAGEHYDLRLNPRKRAVAVLQGQCRDTTDLRSHVDHAQNLIDDPNAVRIRSLLAGLAGELAAGGRMLQERLGSLAPDSTLPQRADSDSQPFWRLFRIDGSDCSAHLEALLSGYVHYARATSDSITFLEMLGDEESAELVKTLFDVADRAIWFIDLYMEGLALHRDAGRFPEFTPEIGVSVSTEADRAPNESSYCRKD